MTVTAKYEDGVFKPLEDVSISEGTLVEVCVPSYAPPQGQSTLGWGFYVLRHVEGPD